MSRKADLQEAKSRFVVWVCPGCGFYDCDPILRRAPGGTRHGPMRCFACGKRAVAALDLSRVAQSAHAWHRAQARETAPLMVPTDVVPRSVSMLTTDDRAELEMLRDVAKRLIGFDGGAEVMPWVDAHRHHADEPYIGCVFCRDQFVPCDDAAVERAVQALAPYVWHDKDAREIIEIALRAAGETP